MEYFYRRNLPHYQPPGGTFFSTFRLVNSLPKSVVSRLKQEYKLLIDNSLNQNDTDRRKLLKTYFQKFDQLLDNAKRGNTWLKKESIAKIIADKIHDFDNKKYTLICYCIMPNHVHLVVKMLLTNKRDESRSIKFPFPLTNTLKLIKGSTAYEANKILNKKGQFWQHESYDHWIRDSDELERIIQYTLLNPVKAGFVSNWKEWQWSYCNEKYLSVQ